MYLGLDPYKSVRSRIHFRRASEEDVAGIIGGFGLIQPLKFERGRACMNCRQVALQPKISSFVLIVFCRFLKIVRSQAGFYFVLLFLRSNFLLEMRRE